MHTTINRIAAHQMQVLLGENHWDWDATLAPYSTFFHACQRRRPTRCGPARSLPATVAQVIRWTLATATVLETIFTITALARTPRRRGRPPARPLLSRRSSPLSAPPPPLAPMSTPPPPLCCIRERYRALRYYLKLYTWG